MVSVSVEKKHQKMQVPILVGLFFISVSVRMVGERYFCRSYLYNEDGFWRRAGYF